MSELMRHERPADTVDPIAQLRAADAERRLQERLAGITDESVRRTMEALWRQYPGESVQKGWGG